MISYADPEASRRTLARLSELTGIAEVNRIEGLMTETPSPDTALAGLERWLRGTSSPRIHLEQVLGLPRLGSLLMGIFGASERLTDSLAQNPELASLVLEPGELSQVPTREAVLREGRNLLSAATSYSHSLDRLRFLKQRWMLPLAIHDLAGTWEQPAIWNRLSWIAEAVLELGRDAAWTEARKLRDLPEECPVTVVAFGKLGAGELNYSSDVDLVYVSPDGLAESEERNAVRFCEAFGRALSDPMGRGSLFRVDLRLRPYGAAGPILRSIRTYEAYYRLYAEPWEVQALLRSRVMVGSKEIAARWEAMRAEVCFRPKVADWFVQQMSEMRVRVEEIAIGDDLKRGRGGIRDVEFLTQILQLLHGSEFEELRQRGTLDVLSALGARSLLSFTEVDGLREGYTFLRKLEHRLQLIGDRQTHTLPTSEDRKLHVARTMGFGSWQEMYDQLRQHRDRIAAMYQETQALATSKRVARDQVSALAGEDAIALARWVDSLPESGTYYAGLLENRDSLRRVLTVLLRAPTLVDNLRQMPAVTEWVMSGEILEDQDVVGRIDRLPASVSESMLAAAWTTGRTVLAVQFVLGVLETLNESVSDLADAVLRRLQAETCAEFDILALGSYGHRQSGLDSDLDVIFLVADPAKQPEAEAAAQRLLQKAAQLAQFGDRFDVDLRLRPDGRKGLLVRSYESIRAYRESSMEPWERFALASARRVGGDSAAEAALYSPLSAHERSELVAMKRRIETERLIPANRHSDLKLGWGGLTDIEWCIRLRELAVGDALSDVAAVSLPERARRLETVGAMAPAVVEDLSGALKTLLRVRTSLHLLGGTGNLLPESGPIPSRIAATLGYASTGSLFETVTFQMSRVRGHLMDTIAEFER